MKKAFKRIVPMILAVCMLVGMMTTFASAATNLSREKTSLAFNLTHVVDKTDETTVIDYKITLRIGKDLAETAAFFRDTKDPDNGNILKMKAMRFTCSINDNLVQKYLNESSLPGTIRDIKQNEIFEFVEEGKNASNGVYVTFKVIDDVCDRWATMTAEEVRDELMATSMYIEGKTDPIPNDELKELCNVYGNETLLLESVGLLSIFPDQETATVNHSRATLDGGADDNALWNIDAHPTTIDSIDYETDADDFDYECVYVEGENGGFWIGGPRPIIYHGTAVPGMLNANEHFTYIFGYPDDYVRPNRNITRAEVATIFYRLMNDDARDKYFTESNSFSDVSRDNWYNKQVSTMANAGIVNGYPDGTFRPDAPITRAEFATITARFDGTAATVTSTFKDTANHWASEYIDRAAELGWIAGYPDHTFRPDRDITRAEACTMINRVLNRAPQYESDLLDNMQKWPDNSDPAAWYYFAMQEATNSHDYIRKNNGYETWTKRLKDKTWNE